MVWTLEILEHLPEDFPKIMGATGTQDEALSSSDSSSKMSFYGQDMPRHSKTIAIRSVRR